MSLIGKYYTIPANTELFCIEVQENIRFSKDIIVEITNTCVPNIDLMFVKRKQLLFNMIGFIPCLIDAGGKFTYSIAKLGPEYFVPEPNIPVIRYKNEII